MIGDGGLMVTPSDAAGGHGEHVEAALREFVAKRDACAVCSGYARWSIADEVRLRKAQANPEAVRREFWRSESGRERRERFFT
jgi:hypothetical protein